MAVLVAVAVVVGVIAMPGSPKTAQATVVDSVKSVVADRTAKVNAILSAVMGKGRPGRGGSLGGPARLRRQPWPEVGKIMKAGASGAE